jgi:hypothetical protein
MRAVVMIGYIDLLARFDRETQFMQDIREFRLVTYGQTEQTRRYRHYLLRI